VVAGDQATAEVGVIGGSGFYEMPGLTEVERVHVPTPYGAPSDVITIGRLHGRRVAFLPRHGQGHRIPPAELNARANIYALKSLGVRRVISVSAVGSLRRTIEPLHAVVPDQLIDRTNGRPSTFFGDGAVAHVGLADPFCPSLASLVAEQSEAAGVTTHRGGTLVVIDGPAFSTRAESRLYQSWGGDIVGMTALPEAKLAREAELCYSALCFATDYDVWHESEGDVTADLVLQNLHRNADRGRAAVAGIVRQIDDLGRCACGDALANALVTAPELVPVETRRRLGLIVERYWGVTP